MDINRALNVAKPPIANHPRLNSFIDEILKKFENTGNFEITYLIWSSWPSYRDIEESDRVRFATIFENHPKIIFDAPKKIFYKKKMYQISKKEDLLEEIERSQYGIENNRDLTDCYQGCDKDLKELIESKAVREIIDTKNRKSLIFPKDPDFDKEYSGKDIPEDFKRSIRDELWKISNDRINPPNEAAGDGGKSKKAEKKERKKKKPSITNTWMRDVMDFDKPIID
jgi:hypothetical protein